MTSIRCATRDRTVIAVRDAEGIVDVELVAGRVHCSCKQQGCNHVKAAASAAVLACR